MTTLRSRENPKAKECGIIFDAVMFNKQQRMAQPTCSARSINILLSDFSYD